MWSQRDLSSKRYVYFWIDGVYFNVRMDEAKQCILVIIGVTEGGSKSSWPLRMDTGSQSRAG